MDAFDATRRLTNLREVCLPGWVKLIVESFQENGCIFGGHQRMIEKLLRLTGI
jgi:hypothetical protein